MKIKEKILKIILITSFSFLLILWPIAFLGFNSDVWLLIQKRNEVVLPEKEIKNYNQEMVSFFKNERELDFLAQSEKSHILNVKNLLTEANMLFLSSLSIAFLFFDYFKNYEKTLRWASLFVIGFISVLLILNFLNFEVFFLKFHQVFFISNYFFPSSSMLKILYPDNFFYEISIAYFILAIIGCLTAILISYKLKV